MHGFRSKFPKIVWYTGAFQRTYEPNQRETLEVFDVVLSVRRTQSVSQYWEEERS
jgi:hypothetical protein